MDYSHNAEEMKANTLATTSSDGTYACAVRTFYQYIQYLSLICLSVELTMNGRYDCREQLGRRGALPVPRGAVQNEPACPAGNALHRSGFVYVCMYVCIYVFMICTYLLGSSDGLVPPPAAALRLAVPAARVLCGPRQDPVQAGRAEPILLLHRSAVHVHVQPPGSMHG